MAGLLFDGGADDGDAAFGFLMHSEFSGIGSFVVIADHLGEGFFNCSGGPLAVGWFRLNAFELAAGGTVTPSALG